MNARASSSVMRLYVFDRAKSHSAACRLCSSRARAVTSLDTLPPKRSSACSRRNRSVSVSTEIPNVRVFPTRLAMCTMIAHLQGESIARHPFDRQHGPVSRRREVSDDGRSLGPSHRALAGAVDRAGGDYAIAYAATTPRTQSASCSAPASAVRSSRRSVLRRRRTRRRPAQRAPRASRPGGREHRRTPP